MKKIMAFMVAAVTFAAAADYMFYWATSDYGSVLETGAYAQLYYINADAEPGTRGTAVSPSDVSGAIAYYRGGDRIVGVTNLGDGSSYATGAFYIEIFGDEGGAPLYDGFAYNNVATYQSLMEDGYIRQHGTTGGYWNAAAIPEPTGGVLLLLGLTALALRRKESV